MPNIKANLREFQFLIKKPKMMMVVKFLRLCLFTSVITDSLHIGVTEPIDPQFLLKTTK